MYDCDVLIAGSGPSGMSCAVQAAALGLTVHVLDEQQRPGGQIYRNIEQHNEKSLTMLGQDYSRGLNIVQAFRDCGAQYTPEATVWHIQDDGRLSFSVHNKSYQIRGRYVVIATGAMERPVPFPGWTLPGVMTLGALDTLYKDSGYIPDVPVTIAGSGPLIYSVLSHLHAFAVPVAHFLDTTPPKKFLQLAKTVPQALLQPGYLLKGLAMLAAGKKIYNEHKRHVTSYAAQGTHHVEQISFCSKGTQQMRPARLLLVHEGIIPRWDFMKQLHLEHQWNTVQRCWHPKTDKTGRSSSQKIYVTGDGTFVHGAIAAEIKGRITAIALATQKGLVSPVEGNRLLRKQQQTLKHTLYARPLVDAMYQPGQDLYTLHDNTLVCRCEEVTAGTIRAAVAQGMHSPEQVKSFTRCGMGPCQSRMCSPAVLETLAAQTEQEIQTLSPLGIRPPVRNLGIDELAQMNLVSTTQE